MCTLEWEPIVASGGACPLEKADVKLAPVPVVSSLAVSTP
jgi:hypothetical protein